MKSFRTALNILTRLPIKADETADENSVLACFALTGVCIGLCMWWLATVLRWAAGPGVAALACAVCLPGLFWWLTRTRSLRGTVRFLHQCPLLATGTEQEVYLRVTAFQVALLVKICLVGWLVYSGRALWLVASLGLAFAMFAELCRGPGPDAEAPWWRVDAHWVVAVVATLVAGTLCGAFLAGVFSCVIVWLLRGRLEEQIEKVMGPADDLGRWVAIEWIDLLVVIAGTLFFLTP
ncbi:MAG: hypothetical protein HN742_34560 [Lentisphaerae bacterium]|nr:hypothetical protein [Lentisphaerota bacterium]MBT4819882.1 hypothetical protein [Lentisphaerota bacterium]MBT5605082.1 hypothetical protein [Lentisphaerota bacterium]MBT7062233.1 hypothetical protein [Lentisphaerota bacterium]MBT7847045.1 hypothetical protein [Lentisphaerota bacterium]